MTERWWDGNAWTEHTRTKTGPAADDTTRTPELHCEQQIVRRATTCAMQTLALIAAGTLGGFWGIISACSIGVVAGALAIFWLPEWRHQQQATRPHNAAIHPSALWWGSGTVSEGTKLNPLQPVTGRSTRTHGTITIYPGHLVLHTATETIAVSAPGPIGAHRTNTSIWIHTQEHHPTNTPERSWTLSWKTDPDGLLQALCAAGFHTPGK